MNQLKWDFQLFPLLRPLIKYKLRACSLIDHVSTWKQFVQVLLLAHGVHSSSGTISKMQLENLCCNKGEYEMAPLTSTYFPFCQLLVSHAHGGE